MFYLFFSHIFSSEMACCEESGPQADQLALAQERWVSNTFILPNFVLTFEQKNTQVGLGAAFNLATANVFSSLGLAAFVTG